MQTNSELSDGRFMALRKKLFLSIKSLSWLCKTSPLQIVMAAVTTGFLAGTSYGGIVAMYQGGRVDSRNSIIYGNTPGNSDTWGSPKYFEYCCTSPIRTEAQKFYLEGNIDAEPLFANAAENDFQLTAESPCRDAGTNLLWMTGATDLAGRPRRDAGAGRVDIGAYEYQSPGGLLLIR